MPFRHRFMLRLRPVLRFVRGRILHIDDSPHRLAGGIAVGLFAGYLPIIGIHMILAYTIAQLCRVNKVVAMLAVWFSNPFTAIFIYYPAYRLGRLLLARTTTPQFGPEQLEQVLESTFYADHLFRRIFTQQFWADVYNLSMQIGLETLIGGILLGLLSAKIGYWVSLLVIERYRRRKHHLFRKLALRRQKTA